MYLLFLNLFISLYCLARFKSAVVLAIVTPLACRRRDSFVEADAINVKDNLPVFAFARLVRGAGGKRREG